MYKWEDMYDAISICGNRKGSIRTLSPEENRLSAGNWHNRYGGVMMYETRKV